MEDKIFFHCCVQKTASRWVKFILSDDIVLEKSALKYFDININFIGSIEQRKKVKNLTFNNAILSPLYIKYEDFKNIPKPKNWKAIFIMRDPRDLLVSWLFSTKYSHKISPYIQKERQKLYEMTNDDSLAYLINKIDNEHHEMYFCMKSWFIEGKKDPKILVLKYENLIGDLQTNNFNKIFNHFEINLTQNELDKLLTKYSFNKLSGREQGSEDNKHHYRKGIAGDWINYFKEDHKKMFKKVAGQLLIDLNYENNHEW